MAHEITVINSKAEMAFVGETPWHGLGQQLEQGADIETWAEAAGMNWRIKRSKVRYYADIENTDLRTWQENHVLLRSDTGAPLGLVSDKYHVVQPSTVLEFFRDMTDDAGYRLHTAGTLFGGRKFWALAKIADDYVTGADKIGGYLLLSTSCDGSMPTECRETTVRVVCNNTLSIAQGGLRNGVIKVGHRGYFDANAVKRRMLDSANNFAGFVMLARQLAQKKVSKAAAAEFVRALLRGVPVGESDLRSGTKAKAPKGEAEILALFHSSAIGGTLLGADGTAWGLVNAVTEYVDHKQPAKTDSHRLAGAFFGAGDALKTRAFDLAFTL